MLLHRSNTTLCYVCTTIRKAWWFCRCPISTSNTFLPQSVNPYGFINIFLGHEDREFSELPSPPYFKDFYNIIGLSTNGQSSLTFSLATQRFLWQNFRKCFKTSIFTLVLHCIVYTCPAGFTDW